MSLTVLAGILFAGSLVAWFVEPSRKVDWIPLFVLSIAVSIIAGRVGELEKRLEKLEPPKP
jgi:hypothetical protein